MRRSLLVVSLLVLAVPVVASAQIRGAWSALVKGDRIHLNVTREHSNWGRTLPRTDFAIADSALSSATETPVHFTFNKDAGAIDFTGRFQNGEGVGRFSFVPSRTYLTTRQSRSAAATPTPMTGRSRPPTPSWETCSTICASLGSTTRRSSSSATLDPFPISAELSPLMMS